MDHLERQTAVDLEDLEVAAMPTHLETQEMRVWPTQAVVAVGFITLHHTDRPQERGSRERVDQAL